MKDRPMGIAGLEQRLIRVLKTDGGFGVLQSFLGRTLLWRRASDAPSMTKINFPDTMGVPSWSWMAYEGPITFIDAPFDGVYWEEKEVLSPWSPRPASSSTPMWHSSIGTPKQCLIVSARTFRLKDVNLERIIFDTGQQRPESRSLKCVIIGRRKSEDGSPTQTHYVLIVEQLSNDRFERVGAGELSKKAILWDDPVVKGKVY